MSFKFHNCNTQINFQVLERSRSFSSDSKLSDQIEDSSKPSDDGLNIRSDIINKLSRNRAHTPQKNIIDAANSLWMFKLPMIFESEIRTHKKLKVKHKSLWKSYKKSYNCQLSSSVTVATQKVFLSDLVMIRKFSELNAEKMLYMFLQIQHENFIVMLETFMIEKIFYIILKHISISLNEIVQCSVYFNELQLTAIIEQVSSHESYKEHTLISFWYLRTWTILHLKNWNMNH